MLSVFRGPAILFAGAFLLTACGSAATTSAVPQNAVMQSGAPHVSGGSWMLSEAKSEDLLYVGTPGKSASGRSIRYAHPQVRNSE
jgi:hypothetical protein